MRTVAALYIDPRGPYPKMPGVECWDEARDARLYEGPHPVVAHPPCGPWGDLRHLSKQDKDGALHAIAIVRTYGGVLEHPHRSKLWEMLPGLDDGPDEFGGYVVQVDQVLWGHPARKRTRLYVVGAPFKETTDAALHPPYPDRKATHWVSGSRKQRSGGGVTPPHIKFCSSAQRRRTPPAFAEWLVALARASRV